MGLLPTFLRIPFFFILKLSRSFDKKTNYYTIGILTKDCRQIKLKFYEKTPSLAFQHANVVSYSHAFGVAVRREEEEERRRREGGGRRQEERRGREGRREEGVERGGRTEGEGREEDRGGREREEWEDGEEGGREGKEEWKELKKEDMDGMEEDDFDTISRPIENSDSYSPPPTNIPPPSLLPPTNLPLPPSPPSPPPNSSFPSHPHPPPSPLSHHPPPPPTGHPPPPPTVHPPPPSTFAFSIKEEFARQGVIFGEGQFRIVDNSDGKICKTYPEKLVFYDKIGDKLIMGSAAFRTRERLATLAYWVKGEKVGIWRSSQYYIYSPPSSSSSLLPPTSSS